MIKLAKTEAENSKVSIRNQRRDANAILKEFHNEKEISQDDLRKGEEMIQKLTDEFVSKVGTIDIPSFRKRWLRILLFCISGVKRHNLNLAAFSHEIVSFCKFKSLAEVTRQ